ncbi:hypothetical protein [Achromobacter sp. NCFB-sbj8-Ac1-l]|uniref:hypothetical protein n=1 Tax=unclassified Achromobacter TaxID=2626865 RepID=UPI004046BD12
MSLTPFELHAHVDEDGFFALVCPDAYQGYVHEDWTLAQVLERFVQQMNAQALFAAFPGPDLADASLRIADVASPGAAWRTVSGLVRVGEGGLWLTDYTQLTMAAQFDDEMPTRDEQLQLPIGPGLYRVTLRQFAVSYEDDQDPAAELVIEPAGADDIMPAIDAVPWFG